MASKDSSSTSASSSSKTGPRNFIHTPLKPASVQDLKAKFDPSKSGGSSTGCRNNTNAKTNTAASRSPQTDRKDAQKSSFGKGSTSVGTKASGVTFSSLSSALHSAAQRRVESNSASSNSSSSSSLSSSSVSSASKTTSTTKSSLTLTTPRPFAPPAAKTSSLPASSKLTFSSASNVKSPTTLNKGSNNTDVRSSFERDSDGRIELPVMHITGGGSNVKVTTKTSPRGSNLVDNRLIRKGDDRSKKEELASSKISNIKSSFEDSDGGSPKVNRRGACATSQKAESPPVQRTNRLVAREITIERLDSGVCVTSYKDQKASSDAKIKKDNSSASTTKTGVKVREIKVQNMKASSSSSSTNSTAKNQSKPEDLPFRQVKLRNTKEQMERQASKDKLITDKPTTDKPTTDKPTTDNLTTDKLTTDTLTSDKLTTSKSPTSELKVSGNDVENKRLSRRMSSERFERLKFDFERGVPTEYSPRKDSVENTDHIELQQKAREFNKTQEHTTPIIAKATKEESIFTEGVKVSDFVKQVNKMNPEVENRPKWKHVPKRGSRTSSAASSDIGGEIGGEGMVGADSHYEGIPGDEMDPTYTDDEDDIYEQVNARIEQPAVVESDQDGIESSKAPGRRLGVYSQVKNLKKFALNKLKQKGGKNKKEAIINQSKPSVTDSDNEIVIHSDGENGWEEDRGGSSSGTDYEDVGQDYLEGGETYAILEPDDKQSDSGAGGNTKGTSLTHKLKKIFVTKGPKEKKKKSKSAAEAAVSVATDSEGEIIDDTDEAESEVLDTLSRTSSERSSGRFVHNDSLGQNSSETSNNKDNTSAAMSQHNPVIITESSSDDMVSPQSMGPGGQSSNQGSAPPPPPLPPRASRNLTQLAENSPPLPPRNATLSGKTTLGVSLDTVIPVSPTGSKRNSHHGGDKKKDRFSFNSQDGSDGGKFDYIDYDPASSQTLERIERNRSRRSNASSSRPTSSASAASSVYMYPDMSAFPELQGEDDDDSLYVDLEDEQIYGKASDIYVSKFESEPLYQWYSKDKMIQNIRSNKTMSSGDLSDEEYLELGKDNSDDANSVYEDVERLLEKNTTSSLGHAKPIGSDSNSSNVSNSSQEELRKDVSDAPKRRSIIEDVFKNGGTLHRALWCQMPEVIKSGLLQKLTDQEKKIQEAMFEIMTSEASYLKSLKILINVFVSAPEFASDHSERCIITRRDRTILFSNIGSIKDISSNFLSDLESRWQDSICQKDVCDIIIRHATKNFEPYVRYCRNQAFQDRALNTLKQNTEFSEAVKRLEQHPNCQFLPLASFLLLPMQRITRLPLLVDAICHRLEPGTDQHTSARKAFESLTKVAKHCDEAAKKIQQAEQMCLLATNLEFKIKEFPIVSASRFLVKQGELTLIKGEGTTRKPLSKLLGSNKEHVYLFLFNDLLLLTKKKGHTYSVRDYCQRNSLHVEAIDNPDKSRHIAPGMATGMPFLLFLAMLANHDNKQVELVLACKSESERSRWIDAVMPTQSQLDNERIYDVWDCPQLQCVRKYLAGQPDELTLEESDVINVTKKLADGWCMGERIRDGEKGWFLASHTEEINNSHVRARNLRLRYRLMMASEEYSQMELANNKR